MKKTDIRLTPEFKAQTTKAILAILFFVLAYIVIVILAMGLTALSIYSGLALIAIRPMLVTIGLGIGLASLGILILIFLFKFIFKSHKVDRSHLTEIKRKDEPELFAMIDEIVLEVKTSFPKKVYLSSDVNAAVFYDSGFWSMFLPVKKNLQIGLGLVNTVSKLELKAILSHEFGHFSQRTMKVGSYVHNVNQVIFNMLYDNASYDDMIQQWANVSNYFSIFVMLAVKIIAGIQWLLKKMYVVVNKSYLALSREMEFHADEIAAHVTGYEPLKNSLLRMSLADHSFNSALNFYNGKITDKVKSENIYHDQLRVMNFFAERSNIAYKNNLPEITPDEQNKFDKSKLVIKDQWASHPTTRERIERLEQTRIHANQDGDVLANTLFKNIEHTQQELTGKLFETIVYEGEPQTLASNEFVSQYKTEFVKDSFSTMYNRYYDNKNPLLSEVDTLPVSEQPIELYELFTDEKVDLVYYEVALKSDIETIKGIQNKTCDIKTFDYDGKRYARKDCDELLQQLNRELEDTNATIKQHDILIYQYFKKLENDRQKPARLEHLYKSFAEMDKSYDTRFEVYTQLSNALSFIHVTTPFEQINSNFSTIKTLEETFKTEIKQILHDAVYQSALTPEIKENMARYTAEEWPYFNGTQYLDENLNILFAAMNNYAYTVSRSYFLLKKELLGYQEELLTKLSQSENSDTGSASN